MRRRLKRLLSCLLALAMVVSSLSLPTATKVVEAATEDGNETSSGVIDYVGVKVDGQDVINPMKLYFNGNYEASLELEAGTHKLQVVNGATGVGDQKEIKLSEKQTVYIRLANGTVYDSVNNADEFQYGSIVGNFKGLELLNEKGERYDIKAWDPSDQNGRMDYVGGGIYKKTIQFKELKEDLTIADGGYKIAFNGSWDKQIGDGEDNIKLTIPAKTAELTFFVDSLNGVVYTSAQSPAYNVTQNSGAVAYPAFKMSVSLIGTVREDESANWDVAAKGYEFTQISDKLFLYQKELKKGAYEYKAAFNYEKWYEKQENKSLTIKEDNTHVVFLYDANEEALYDSITNEDKIADKLGMKTEPATSSVTTNPNGTTKFVTTAATKETDAVQLIYAKKEKPEETKKITLQKGTNGSGKFNGTFATSDVFFGDEEQDLVYYYEVNGTKVLDSSAEKVDVKGTAYSVYKRAEFKGRLVTVPGTLSNPGWDPSTNAMEYKGNGIYTYTFKSLSAGNYEFKIAMGSWDENYGQEGKAGGANYQVAVPKKQDVTVMYNDITTHYAVTSVDYIVADISLSGTGIPEGMKFSDPGFAGIYTCVVDLKAGTYSDVTMTYNGETYKMDSFTTDKDKKVTFYFDPSTDIYYNDSTMTDIDASKVYFNSKDATYKSAFGAVEEGQAVTYKIQTGLDATKVKLVVKGAENKTVDFEKTVDGDKAYWSGDLKIDEYGQYKYFFVIFYGTSVKIYCDDDGNYGAGTLTDLTSLKPYDLIVYKKGFKTPDWMKNGVVCQIFPDRFFNGDKTNDDAQTLGRGDRTYEFITDWSKLPENVEQEQLNKDKYPSNAYRGDGEYSTEIYGGDLKGIIKRMDYLQEVGVSVIYLNPIFASISSHRYDTTDYMKIDPILGDLGSFEELVTEAKKHGMHIVLDGVFNHVSDDSIYFDRYYKFVGKDGKVGAYPYWAYVYDYMDEKNVTKEQAEQAAKDHFKALGVTDFSYTEWFVIFKDQPLKNNDNGNVIKDTTGDRKGKDVYGYDSWWGYDNMPIIYSTDGSEFQTGNWGKTVIEGEGSVAEYWLNKGSNGWRLDVANEVSDETWQHLRKAVKALNEDNVIIGEIWTDATKYILGDMYDSVMNYVFRDAVLAYAKGGSSVDALNTLERMRERYPKEAFYAMMNLVASHDTTRVLSFLDGIPDDRGDKTIEGAFPSYEKTSEDAKQRQYLVAMLQMTYAGAPMIYYGDEMGMVGADDPDNRRGATWGEGNKDIVEWYAYLTKMRDKYTALRTGEAEAISLNDAILGYVRKDSEDQLLVLMNNTKEDQQVQINIKEYLELGGSVLYDLVKGKAYDVPADGMLTITVPAYRGVVLTEHKKDFKIDTEKLKPAYDPSYKVQSRYEGISLDKKECTMNIGDKLTLSATTNPKNVADVKGTVWKSSNEKVVTVKDGVVTAVAAGTAKVTVTLGGKSASCTIKVAEKKVTVAQVKGAKVKEAKEDFITLQWSAVSGVKGYEVERLDGRTWRKIADTNKTMVTDKKLNADSKYSYRIRAYVQKDGKKVYGPYSTVIAAKTAAIKAPEKVTKVKVKAQSTSKVKVSWKKVANASGYNVYMKTNNGSYKKVATVKDGRAESCKVYNLQEGYNYQFKVVAYRQSGKKVVYAKDSNVASIRMSVSAPKKISAKQTKRGKANVSWSKVNGVSGYEIMMSTNGGKYKKIITVKKGKTSSVNVYNLKKGKKYRFQIRAYKVVDGKKQYSSTVTSNKLKMR